MAGPLIEGALGWVSELIESALVEDFYDAVEFISEGHAGSGGDYVGEWVRCCIVFGVGEDCDYCVEEFASGSEGFDGGVGFALIIDRVVEPLEPRLELERPGVVVDGLS